MVREPKEHWVAWEVTPSGSVPVLVTLWHDPSEPGRIWTGTDVFVAGPWKALTHGSVPNVLGHGMTSEQAREQLARKYLWAELRGWQRLEPPAR
jgi:hypothetical protein